MKNIEGLGVLNENKETVTLATKKEIIPVFIEKRTDIKLHAYIIYIPSLQKQ